MPTTVLVVEDEPNIGALVRTYLERAGYHALWVRSGEDALTELRRHPVRLVILDIGLPGMDGFEVCRRIAGEVPVIMLTARDEEADRVAGLEVGADDYVAKPFSPRELTARVKAVLRRAGSAWSSADAQDVLELGPVVLARGAREVRVDGAEVELTQREFDLLEYLLRHAGQRQELGREQRDRYARPLRRRPQPVHGPVGRPRLHVRLQKGEAQAEHAGAAFPAIDQRPAFGPIERETAEDREAVGMGAHRRDRQLVRIRVPARRMQQCAIDAGRVHVA